MGLATAALRPWRFMAPSKSRFRAKRWCFTRPHLALRELPVRRSQSLRDARPDLARWFVGWIAGDVAMSLCSPIASFSSCERWRRDGPAVSVSGPGRLPAI